jgi:hypothetical protein
MRIQTTIALIAAATLAMASMSAVAQGRHGQGSGAQPTDRTQIERGQKDTDRDRLRDRDRITNPAPDRDRTRDQDRTHAPDQATSGEKGIYGGKLMSEQERSEYREQLRLTESDSEARARFMAKHKAEMQKRASARGMELKDPPEAEEAE